MPATIFLMALLLAGIVARSNLIATAACILLILKFLRCSLPFYLLEKHGLDLGLLFLLLAILVPVATGKVNEHELFYSLTTLPGILSVLGGALATLLNSEGLKLLQLEPGIIFGLVIGSVFGILALGGIPVGPLMAAGITALILNVIDWIRR